MRSPRLRQLFILSLPLTSTVAQPEPSPSENILAATNPPQRFRELLNAVPEESLHAALEEHLRPKYQEGVYEHDRSALERVHNDDPSLASRLLASAASSYSRLELLKRQNATSPPPATSSQPPPVVVPVEIPSTNAAGSSIVVTTSAVAQATASVAVQVTQDGQVVTSTAPAVIVSSTDAVGNVQVVTSAVPAYTPPAAEVGTTTDAKGKTLVTTYTPTGEAVSSLVLSTMTLADGSRSTVTSFAVAGMGGKTPVGDAGSQATNTNSPTLQNGAVGDWKSRSLGGEAIALVAGAVGVAYFL